ncbi:hypothetical protein GH714_040945 [Hevea brasiliensis]|uniref:Uncharacterized protein n=1 Tax=Hevea brasiliensis TaxID=3981 RepID=A0A6A6MIW8_HEVBR|nr:hypothetical protein GH714_040945 [Hevea brasiliensis]
MRQVSKERPWLWAWWKRTGGTVEEELAKVEQKVKEGGESYRVEDESRHVKMVSSLSTSNYEANLIAQVLHQ